MRGEKVVDSGKNVSSDVTAQDDAVAACDYNESVSGFELRRRARRLRIRRVVFSFVVGMLFMVALTALLGIELTTPADRCSVVAWGVVISVSFFVAAAVYVLSRGLPCVQDVRRELKCKGLL